MVQNAVVAFKVDVKIKFGGLKKEVKCRFLAYFFARMVRPKACVL